MNQKRSRQSATITPSFLATLPMDANRSHSSSGFLAHNHSGASAMHVMKLKQVGAPGYPVQQMQPFHGVPQPPRGSSSAGLNVPVGGNGNVGITTATPAQLQQLQYQNQLVIKQRLLELCQKHGVDLRTIEWFALPEHAVYWETLARKLEEIDRRSHLGDGHFKVKNPSAWLTKFFNTIRK